MQILNPLLSYCVTRLDLTFADANGHEKKYWGTGFWMSSQNNNLSLVTNRHNFDLSLKCESLSRYKLSRLKILLRKQNKEGKTTDGFHYFEIDLRAIQGRLHPTADVAVITNLPVVSSNLSVDQYQNPICLSWSEIADDGFIASWCEMFDPVGFIGFPQDWYDHSCNGPIGRIAYISSDPRLYLNSNIKTANTTLVTGLSFGGSSGSPVFFLPKGLNLASEGGIQVKSPYTSGKLIGIMSGHWDNPTSSSNTFSHSGLSYFTKVSSICELLTMTESFHLRDFIHPRNI